MPGAFNYPIPPPVDEPAPTKSDRDAATEMQLLQGAVVAVSAELAAAVTVDGLYLSLVDASVLGAREAAAQLARVDRLATDHTMLDQAAALIHRGHTAERALWEVIEDYRIDWQAAGGYLARQIPSLLDARGRILAACAGVAPPAIWRSVVPGPVEVHRVGATAYGLLAAECATRLVVTQTEHAELLKQSVATLGLSLEWRGGGSQAHQGVSENPRLLVTAHTASGARAGAAAGAAGIGLLRTELVCAGDSEEPSIAEQAARYRAIVSHFAGRHATIRVFDVGADKPLAFTSPRHAGNAALGERGLRYLRRNADVLDRQLAAISATAAETSVITCALAPMVSVPEEAAWFAVRARSHGIAAVGVMVEVPSAAILAKELAETVDFLSIGTNDLAQYVFATDRALGGTLGAFTSPWQPALLRLVRDVLSAASASECPTSVCGEAAGDPMLAVVLAGLGATSLSAHASALLPVRDALAAIDAQGRRAIADAACAAPDLTTARRVVAAEFETRRRAPQASAGEYCG